jgi:hypothetical protein
MLRQVKGAGDFEGTVSFGLGLASTSGFRVFTLSGPDRLVVDVAIPGGGALAVTGEQHILPTVIAGLALVMAGAVVTRLARRFRRSTAVTGV